MQKPDKIICSPPLSLTLFLYACMPCVCGIEFRFMDFCLDADRSHSYGGICYVTTHINGGRLLLFFVPFKIVLYNCTKGRRGKIKVCKFTLFFYFFSKFDFFQITIKKNFEFHNVKKVKYLNNIKQNTFLQIIL